MIRTVVGRVATGAAGATAAATAMTTGQAHAHGRPMRLVHGSVVDEQRDANGGATLQIEDEWLVPQMKGGDVFFSAEEIEQTVNDICGIASSQSKVNLPIETNNMEKIDTDANAIIDEANIVPAGEGLQKLAKMTNIMLNRPSIQQEIIEAFQQEPELRDMIQSLSCRQGDLDFITFGQKSALPPIDPQVEDVTDAQPKTFFQSLMDDIGKGLEAAGEGLARTGTRIGSFLGKIGRWLRKKAVGGDAEEDLSNTDRIIGLTMCFASVVMAVLVAKRIGMLRLLFRR